MQRPFAVATFSRVTPIFVQVDAILNNLNAVNESWNPGDWIFPTISALEITDKRA